MKSGTAAYTARVGTRPAVFIDRDGTLTEEVGYVNHPARLRLLPRSAEAIRRLNRAGTAAVVVTNQAGIARGYFSGTVMHAVNAELSAQLERAGARLDGIYVCPHHPTEGEAPYRMLCDCRKPNPGLFLTGYGLGEWEYRRDQFAVTPDHVAGDLLDAVEWALKVRAA